MYSVFVHGCPSRWDGGISPKFWRIQVKKYPLKAEKPPNLTESTNNSNTTPPQC